MDKAAIDVAKALARLSELTIFELRGEWRRLHRMPPPMRFSRDLLTRGISYKLQERAYGGLSTATARKLERASADPLGRGAVKPAPPISLSRARGSCGNGAGSPTRSSSMPTVSNGAVSATVPSPWSHGRSPAPAGRARGSSASGGGSWTLPQARERAMARADHVRAGAGMARGHPHGPHPCRRYRMARSALPFPLRGRTRDHRRPLVGPAVLRPQAAAAGLLRERAMARADHVRAGLTIRCAVYTRAPRRSRCGLAPRRAHAAWMYS